MACSVWLECPKPAPAQPRLQDVRVNMSRSQKREEMTHNVTHHSEDQQRVRGWGNRGPWYHRCEVRVQQTTACNTDDERNTDRHARRERQQLRTHVHTAGPSIPSRTPMYPVHSPRGERYRTESEVCVCTGKKRVRGLRSWPWAVS